MLSIVCCKRDVLHLVNTVFDRIEEPQLGLGVRSNSLGNETISAETQLHYFLRLIPKVYVGGIF